MAPPPPPEEPPAPEPPAETQIVAARPAWRTVEQPRGLPKKKLRGRAAEPAAPPPQPVAPPPVVEPPRMQAWSTWKRSSFFSR